MALPSRLENETIFLRGADHASEVFGLKNDILFVNNPKTKFEHFVIFNVNQSPSVVDHKSRYFKVESDFKHLGGLVKTADYPSMKIQTEHLNQYNKHRHVYTGIEFNPVTITMHDVADGKTLRLWQMYYSYYFKNGHYNNDEKRFINEDSGRLQNLPTDTDISHQSGSFSFGYNSASHNGFGLKIYDSGSNFFSSIDIYFSRAGKAQKVSLINPKITDFKHDMIDYSSTSDVMEISFTFDYEFVIYDEQVRDLAATRVQIPGINPQINNPSPAAVNIAQPDRRTHTQNSSTVNATGASTGSQSTGLFGNSAFGNVANRILGNVTTNVQSGLGNIANSLGNNVANAAIQSIRTGNFTLRPDPRRQVRNVIGNAGSNARSQALGAARGVIAAQVSTLVSNVRSGIRSSNTPPESSSSAAANAANAAGQQPNPIIVGPGAATGGPGG